MFSGGGARRQRASGSMAIAVAGLTVACARNTGFERSGGAGGLRSSPTEERLAKKSGGVAGLLSSKTTVII